MNDDPNHFYQYVRQFREKLATGLFLDHDVRPFQPTWLNQAPDMAAQFSGVKHLFDSMDEAFLDTLEEFERRLLAESANGMLGVLQGVQNQFLNSGGQLDRGSRDQFSIHFQRMALVTNGLLMARFLKGEATYEQFRAALTNDIAAASAASMAETTSALEAIEARSADLVRRIQRDLSEAAVAKNANFFRSEAARYAQLAFWWGMACVVWFGLLIAGAAVVAFNAEFTGRFLAELKSYVPTMPDQWLLLQVLASKLFVVGALTYVGVVLVKAFMSVLNAHVTNRHRAVSLDTYKFLLDGAQTDSDRQAIIQRAAEAVFALQETGLIKAVPGGEGNPFNTTINFPKLT